MVKKLFPMRDAEQADQNVRLSSTFKSRLELSPVVEIKIPRIEMVLDAMHYSNGCQDCTEHWRLLLSMCSVHAQERRTERLEDVKVACEHHKITSYFTVEAIVALSLSGQGQTVRSPLSSRPFPLWLWLGSPCRRRLCSGRVATVSKERAHSQPRVCDRVYLVERMSEE